MGGVYLSSSWLLWGGVGREAGTSTVLGVWFRARSPSPFLTYFTEKLPKPIIRLRSAPPILITHYNFYICDIIIQTPNPQQPDHQILGQDLKILLHPHYRGDQRSGCVILVVKTNTLTLLLRHLLPLQLLCRSEAVHQLLLGDGWRGGGQRGRRSGGVTEVILEVEKTDENL